VVLPAAQASAYGEVVKKLRENLLTIYAGERFGKLRPMTAGRLGIGARLVGGVRIVWFILIVLRLIGPLLRMLARR
jgi:hypothetical protein